MLLDGGLVVVVVWLGACKSDWGVCLRVVGAQVCVC